MSELADRIRELVEDQSAVTEMAMFGGRAFLVDGNMAIAASGQGGILVRVPPADADGLLASPGADAAVMGGRRLRGWLRVSPDYLETESQLAVWVQRGVDYARSLPAKGRARPRR